MRRPMTLGQVIRGARQAKGWTQEMLAVQVDDGMTQSDVSRLERDKITLPRRDRLERLSDALDVALGELLASSGWAAADRFFDPPTGVEHNEPAAEEPRPSSVAIDALGSPTVARLHEAMALSRELRERTDQLLQQSRDSVHQWERSFDRRPQIEPRSECDNR